LCTNKKEKIYKLTASKYLKLVSPATFVNESDKV